MSYANETILANDAYERLKALNPQAPPSLIPRLVTVVPAALAELTSRAIDNPEWRDALTRTFTVTAAAGEADIAVPLTEGLAQDALYGAELYHASSPLQMEWMPDVTTLALLAKAGFLGVAQEGTKLYFSDIAGAVGTLAGTVTIKAVGVPTLPTVPVRLEPMLVDAVVRLATGEKAKEPA